MSDLDPDLKGIMERYYDHVNSKEAREESEKTFGRFKLDRSVSPKYLESFKLYHTGWKEFNPIMITRVDVLQIYEEIKKVMMEIDN